MRTPTAESTIFFLCDLQTRFRPAILGFDQLVFTTNRLLRLAKILGCEVICCTQVARALGPIDPAIDLKSLGPLYLGTYDKSSFTMIIPEVQAILESRPSVNSIVIFGIESHICVLQTAISLLSPSFRSEPYIPYVVADCISSHNTWEVPIVLDRLRQEGAIVTTTETLAFQLIGSTDNPQFTAFSLRKEGDQTTEGGP